MSRQESDYHLIIKQAVLQADELKGLSGSLFWESGIDANVSAQAITGSGYATLHRGMKHRLDKASSVLDQYGIHNWMYPETRTVRFVPRKITGYSTDQGGMHFITQTREIVIENNDHVHVFIGDIKGDAVRKMREEAGKNAALDRAKPSPEETRRSMYRTLLINNPIADIYIFSPSGQFRGAARISPAGGISLSGERKPEASERLHDIISAIRERAGRLVLNMEFGFSRIAGTWPSPGENHDEVLENAEKLVRFGNSFVIMDQIKPFADMKNDLPFLSESYLMIAADPVPASESSDGRSENDVQEKAASGKFSRKTEESFVWDASHSLLPPPDEPSKKIDKKIPVIIAFIAVYIIFGLMARSGRSEFVAGLMDAVVKYGVETGVIFACASVFLMLFGFRYITNKRLIENIPTSRARSASMGMCELKGRAVRKYNLVSPITLTPCVYYSIEKFRKNSKDSWTRYSSETRCSVPFYIEDDTGKMLVHPEGAVFYGIRKDEYQSMFLMAGLEGSAKAMPIPNGEKWTEALIAENSPLYVLGWVEPVAKGADALKDKVLEKLREMKQDRSALMAYDEDGDGKISQDEWEKVRTDMEDEALKESLDGKHHGRMPSDSVVMLKPEISGMPLIIAPTRMEERITRRFMIIGVSCFTGAVIFAITAIVYGLL